MIFLYLTFIKVQSLSVMISVVSGSWEVAKKWRQKAGTNYKNLQTTLALLSVGYLSCSYSTGKQSSHGYCAISCFFLFTFFFQHCKTAFWTFSLFTYDYCTQFKKNDGLSAFWGQMLIETFSIQSKDIESCTASVGSESECFHTHCIVQLLS